MILSNIMDNVNNFILALIVEAFVKSNKPPYV